MQAGIIDLPIEEYGQLRGSVNEWWRCWLWQWDNGTALNGVKALDS